MSVNIGQRNIIKFKKINKKLHSSEKINDNRNNSNPMIFDGLNKDKIHLNKEFKRDISPYKQLNKDSSPTKYYFDKFFTLLNKKSKKYYIKGPLLLFKTNNQNNTKNIDFNKNIPFIAKNINQNKNNQEQGNKSIINNNKKVEYNTINCIINNYNLSYKNLDSLDDKKAYSIGKIKKFNEYDIFNKNNNKLKANFTNIKNNNNNSSNYINKRNISNLSENDSNINKYTNLNDESKIDEMVQENNKIKQQIKKRTQKNKEQSLLLKELEKKNQRLKQEYQEIKTKNMEFSKSLERLYKFLKVLKKSGLEVSQMMENISSGEDYDEFDDDSELEEEKSDTKKRNKKECKKSESQQSESSSIPISNIRQLSSGPLKNNEKYYEGSKLDINLKKNIPLLNLDKIQKHHK